jgi:hypothetical protein
MGKVNAILDMERPEKFVQGISAPELHQLIHHIGIEDAAVLVPMMDQDQFQAMLDLDLWVGFNFQPERLERWMWSIEEYGDLDHLAARINGLDDELVVSILTKWIRIHVREDKNEDPILPDDSIVFLTPDQKYFVEIFGEDREDHFAVVDRLIKSLYRISVEESIHILDRVSSELPVEVEEGLLRFRNARLEDLGFAPYELAIGMVAYLDPAETKGKIHHYLHDEQDYQARDVRRVGTALMPVSGTENFLTRVLGLIDDPKQQDQFILAFTYLQNRSSVVHFADLSDIERLGDISREVFATLNVGLEYLAEGNLDLGRKILTRMHIQDLHRVGHSLPQQAARVARSGLKCLGGDQAAEIFDAPLDDFLAAVTLKTPLFAEAILGEGSTERRVFGSMAEVLHAGNLAVAARLVCLFFGERFDLHITANPDDPDEKNVWSDVRLSSMWLTLLALQATDEPIGVNPISMSVVQYWCSKVCEDGPERAQHEVIQQSARLIDGLGDFDDETRAALEVFVVGTAAKRVVEDLASVQERPFNSIIVSDLFLISDDEPGASSKLH